MKNTLKLILSLTALIFMVGCFGNDDDDTTPVKIESGKWRLTQSIDNMQTMMSFSMGGVVIDSVDTTEIDTTNYTDTSELLLVTSDSLKYYSKGEDTTYVMPISNDLEMEFKKAVDKIAKEMQEDVEDGVTAKINKAEVTNVSTSVSGNVMTITFTGVIDMEISGTEDGVTVAGTTKIDATVTEKYETFGGDIPPSDWPTTVVTEEFEF